MHEMITKARARLLLDAPFFGTLALRLTPIAIHDKSIPTGATDGKHLFYNVKWLEKQREAERVGFVAHEVMHVALLHMLRRNGRDGQRWNIAADYVINNTLIKENFVLPHTELINPDYDNMSTDEVYNLLPKDIGQTGILGVLLQSGEDPGGCGGVLDHPDISSAGAASGALEAEMQVAIQQAAEAAKACGKLSANIESLVNEVLSPKVDWKSILARFLRANNKSDFTWLKPNRRFIAQGLYLPSLYNPCLDEIAVVTDSSGSVSDEELTQFLSETTSILHELNPTAVHFIQCDSEVKDYKVYTREDLPLKVNYKGRGGTAFAPAIEYANKHCPHISALVYLTDLESNDFGSQPDYPVLWVTTYSEEAPYGEIIKM